MDSRYGQPIQRPHTPFSPGAVTWDEKNFKKHLADLVYGHPHPEKHDRSSDRNQDSPSWKTLVVLPGWLVWSARLGAPGAAILMPLGFFLSAASPRVAHPIRMIYLVYAGAARRKHPRKSSQQQREFR